VSMLIWADWVILGIVLISALVSLLRGFAREAISLGGWIAATWISLTFLEPGAELLVGHVSQPSARLALSFLALFLGVLLLTGIAATVVGMIVDKTGLTGTDRVLGMVFGAARGLVIVGLLVLGAGMTPLPQDPWWRESVVIPHVERLAITVGDALPPDIASRLKFSG